MPTVTMMHMMLEKREPVCVQLRSHPNLPDCWLLMIREKQDDFTISCTRAQLEELSCKLEVLLAETALVSHLEVDRVARVPSSADLRPDAPKVDE